MDIDLYKQRKKELKMTFDDLAAKTNISKRTLIELFNNKRSKCKRRILWKEYLQYPNSDI